VTLPTQYATVEELATYWRPLSNAEADRADDLLTRAATLINEERGAATFVQSACNAVSLDMVKRAMLGGSGVSGSTQAMADMSATVTYVNPVGNLYLTRAELQRLTGEPSGAAFSLTPTSNTRVPLNRWNYQQSTQTTDVSP
jgi:hypothetical protein